jgi:glycosyltransferase involved in cell wall biosynthesis
MAASRHIALEADRMPNRVAVLIPCHNEELTIGQVVQGFRAALPDCRVYVYDNNSTDDTIGRAREAGAVVRTETLQGKGNVVRRMFSDIDADIYVMADGDGTYDPTVAPAMIRRIETEALDMVVGVRQIDETEDAFRRGHRVGNRTLTGFVGWLFGHRFTDILSGYRAFSRRFVKSFPVLSGGFEIETELTVHALELELSVAEIRTPYYARPEGSESKLSTWRDGFRILGTILKLYRSERPLRFFSSIGVALAAVSIGLAVPIVIHFIEYGNVPRLPSAILAMGLMLAAFMSIASGLILDTVTRGRREVKLLAYLEQRAPGDEWDRRS